MALKGLISLWFLALSLLCLVAFSDQAAFDYFALVQQWPPASCKKARPPPCPQPVPKRFTIHGLWPQKNTGSITDCPGPAFDANKIRGIRNQLNIQWPNVLQRNANERFWAHEWKKHGTCWIPGNQLRYFQQALNLKKKNNLLRILQGAGLAPSNRNRNLQQIKNAIKNKVQGRVQPALRCITIAGGRKQLNEIVLCYKNNAVTPQNCPASLTNCPAQVVWVPRNSTTFFDLPNADSEDAEDVTVIDLEGADDSEDADELTADGDEEDAGDLPGDIALVTDHADE